MIRLRGVLVILAVVLLAAACGDSDSDDSGGEASDIAPAMDDSAESSDPGVAETSIADAASDGVDVTAGQDSAAPPADLPAEQAGDTGSVPVGENPAPGRSLVFTAEIALEVADVAAASRQAVELIEERGGFVFGQQSTSSPVPMATYTFKITPARFQDALDALGGVGLPVSQNVNADDVTGRIIDLESRIATGEASVERLRALVAEAADLEQLASLEQSLVERETELEVLRGQLRTVSDQVALATIVVTLSGDAAEPRLDVEHTAYRGDDGGERCPGDADLTVDEGESVVMCVIIENSGDVVVDGIEIEDRGLRVDASELIEVEGSASEPLAPGGRLVVAYEIDADDKRPDLAIDARALDAEGSILRQPVEIRPESLAFRVVASDALPGFGDSISSAWVALTAMIGVLVVLAGWAVPFLWLVPLAGGLYWWRRRRQASVAGPSAPEGSTPTTDASADTSTG